ncbi:MAG: spondin domain-containing protein [Algibacter sp.]|uniref:spondin domain-containing protein n=1 Tax=Algibacter sp. TaxID=1872428 RepID=UPI003297B0B7
MRTFILLLVILIVNEHHTFGQSIANYDISVTTIWNTTAHTSVPNNAHWSPLVGATHKNPNDILEFGVPAPLTNGIKDVAEIGVNTNFEHEINTLITAGNANQYLEQGFSPTAGNNSNATINNVSVSEDFPLITLVSMVAPSPDWFIAISSLNLRSGNNTINNGWKDTFTLDVFAYDAGTDSGTDYTSNNMISNPRAPISIISGFPINGNRMASITFKYNTSTLSLEDSNALEPLKTYPNPIKNNKLYIENTGLNTTYKITNLYGRPVLSGKVSNKPVDCSSLASGPYLLILTRNNYSVIKKIIK